jgi:hypothetical protein
VSVAGRFSLALGKLSPGPLQILVLKSAQVVVFGAGAGAGFPFEQQLRLAAAFEAAGVSFFLSSNE